jgi:hypothetical protein
MKKLILTTLMAAAAMAANARDYTISPDYSIPTNP